MLLSATVSICDRKLIVNVHDAVVAKGLRPETAEWIWQDLLPGRDRRETVAIPNVSVIVTKLGLLVEIGKAPNALPVPIAVDGRGRGIVQERQTAVNEGRAPGLWQVVLL